MLRRACILLTVQAGPRQDPVPVQRFKRDQFLVFAYMAATAMETGAKVSSSFGNLSIHLTTSSARPFSFIQFISDARSEGLRTANGFTFSNNGRNFFSSSFR